MRDNWEKLRHPEDGELILRERAFIMNTSVDRVISQDDRKIAPIAQPQIEPYIPTQNISFPDHFIEVAPKEVSAEPDVDQDVLSIHRQAIEAAFDLDNNESTMAA